MEYVKVRTVYCDMDGVLADFSGHFHTLFGMDADNMEDPQLWNLIDEYGKFKFFLELPWMPGSEQMWKYITNNFMHVKILSALGKSDSIDKQTTKGKRAWLSKHIPGLRDQDIILVENKHKKRHYSKPGDIIIDDRPVVIQEWNHKGGIGILHKNAQDTIKILEKHLYDEVE